MPKPAIEGGVPVRKGFLPYGHQWLDDEDIAAVTGILKTDWITQGPEVLEFEKKVADYCGAKYAVAVANGTAALHAACAVAGIGPGDEVIVSDITFVGVANMVVFCGGHPVFADIKRDDINIDPDEIKGRLSPRTRAILPVDFAGQPADLDAVMSLARERGVPVIEDAAHALGAEYRGHRVGSLADMTILSFHPVKHITTGEGGMVLTDNEDFYERLKKFRHHGMIHERHDELWYYEVDEPGHNFRLTGFQCALGISQLKKLEGFIRRRREIAASYDAAFAEMEGITPLVTHSGVRAVYHIYVVQLNLERLRVGRREIFNALRAENIGVQVHYLPLHLHPYYRREFGYQPGDYPRAEEYYARALTLPLFPAMSEQDVADVIAAVKKVVRYYHK
ncbi:UDP-4-amino-4,6-dideoxy-N-acetyl-beta-L-altrosamine transaminase [Chloroflexota bacterium]